jgi:hypothetical protein
MADLEILEVVATLDFAHRHMGQAALFPVIAESTNTKSPEAKSVFYGIRAGTSTNGSGAQPRYNLQNCGPDTPRYARFLTLGAGSPLLLSNRRQTGT